MDLNSQQILHDIHMLKNSLGLSERIMDNARHVMRDASEKGLVRGRTHETLVGAAVYIACRQTGSPRTLQVIATVVNIKRKILAKYCRLLINKLCLNLPIIDPSECVIKLAQMIDANERAKGLATVMMNEIIKQEISTGKNPMSIAASVLFICCERAGYHTSQRSIARAAGITEVTLRNRFREVKRKMNHWNR